jgi:hypothetical protein
VIKVAILYVGLGQEDEKAILHNQIGSDGYREFVSSLGWEVDLATHPGYLGGLDKNQANGGRAPYYCTSTLEVIFHDATMMPTDPNDPKQVKKVMSSALGQTNLFQEYLMLINLLLFFFFSAETAYW